MIKVIHHPDKVFKDMEEAKEELPKINPKHEVVWGYEVTMVGDGLKIGKEGDTHQIAASGLKSLFKQLKIPYKYGVDILPTENSINDVNTLLEVSEKRFMVITNPEDGSVVGFTSEEFTPIPYRDIINMVVPPVDTKVESIRVNDERMFIDVVKDRDIEPVTGDISKVGNRIGCSNTGFGDLDINTFLFRLICSNGSTVAKEFGGASFSLIGRSTRDILTDGMIFTNQATADIAHITAGLDRMVKLPIGEMEMYNIEHQRYTKIPALEALPKRVRKVISNKDQTEQIFKDVDPTTRTYDVYNNITQAAHRFSVTKRVQLEEVGGSVLSVAMKDVRKAA